MLNFCTKYISNVVRSRNRLSTDTVQSGTIHCTNLSHLKNELYTHKILIISKNNRLLTFDVKNYLNKNDRQ